MSSTGTDTAGRLAAPLASPSLGRRLDGLRRRLDGLCDVLVVTSPANLRWLTGFSASNMAALVTPDLLVLATDRRYQEALDHHLDAVGLDAVVRISRDVIAAVAEAAPLTDVDTGLGLEANHITWHDQRSVAELVGADVPLVATTGVVEEARSVKDPGELDRLRRAAAIADHALGSVVAEISPGMTERQLARRLEAVMLDAGADEPAFPTIVAAGPNAARPHAVPSDRPLEAGDLLVIDMGARFDGYGSDMTRTFTVGSFTEETELMYRAVVEAQQAGVATVAAGVEPATIDAACRDVLTDLGLGSEFVHGTGHGIGLDVHEEPFLSATANGSGLVAGNVVTVEPGVYRSGVGGARIEDSVIVTADGCEPITLSPKEPLLGS